MAVLYQTIDIALDNFAKGVGCQLESDILSYLGEIHSGLLSPFRTEVENLADREDKTDNLAFLIYTGGGVVEIVEKMVEIVRHYYEEIWFIVPDLAMSAGTILCMAGDKIYMDYSSALGPIDPQVENKDGQLVPALGYLDHVDSLIKKAEKGTLTDAEYSILRDLDVASLRRYEQAKNLSISLLKEWLAKYKFKDWSTHSSTGKPVTQEEKEKRAEEIAEDLNDHTRWHSHNRMIGTKTLTKDLRLQIEDYSDMHELKMAIRHYSDLLLDCARTRNLPYLLHSAKYDHSACIDEENS